MRICCIFVHLTTSLLPATRATLGPVNSCKACSRPKDEQDTSMPPRTAEPLK